MAKRDNHYEAAFEAWLRARGLAYVAVDEARRSVVQEGTIKNLDFIVSTQHGQRLLVDIKGRQFPSGAQRRYWTNWSTRDDVDGLSQWQQLFGQGFQALFVFAYCVLGDRSPLPAERLFAFRGQRYAFLGIRVGEYAPHARLISPKWNTVSMPVRLFRRYAEPLESFLA